MFWMYKRRLAVHRVLEYDVFDWWWDDFLHRSRCPTCD